jgi:hypothetical protein
MRVTRHTCYLLVGGLLLVQGVALGQSAGPTFTVDPSSGPRGSSYQAAASGPGNTCPSPSDVVIVAFFDARGAETESEPIPVQPDGSWQASLTVPAGAAPGQAQVEAGCHPSATADEPSLAYVPVGFTVTG